MDRALTIEEMTKQTLLAALSWQAEMGADEALLDTAKQDASWHVSLKDIEQAEDRQIKASQPSVSTATPQQDRAPSQQPSSVATPAIQSANRPPAAGGQTDLSSITDLASLKMALAQFEGCDLKRTASNLVFSDGHETARIMIIGEAPGKDEDRMGSPFVGSAGQLLDQMLGSVKLDRTSVYITNILPWRPPGNRPPTAEEVTMMRPFLEKHIALIDPEVILALGGSAAKMLLQSDEGIMKLRGKFHEFTPLSDTKARPLLPCLHPGYLLRSPHHKYLVFQDLVKLQHYMNRDT